MNTALFRALLLLAAFVGFSPARAEEAVKIDVCFNYGCITQWSVAFAPNALNALLRELAEAKDAESEREKLAAVIGRLYALAAEQTPVGNDKGGNYADVAVWGRMDCIDHSTTTTRFLRLIEARGGLRWHRVLEPVRRMRFFVLQHLSAVIEDAEGKAYAVDSWFVDNGEPAIILPLEDWMNGAGPDV
ncbi:MAG: hypothetical protein LBI31_00460 [Zoogloeaceae bacterium]|jgi:hypothetical protein|nr:hypothetical protein [Zoogloeaceae bacterium]